MDGRTTYRFLNQFFSNSHPKRNPQDKKNYSQEQISQALEDASNALPHFYKLYNSPEKLRTLVFGCQGDPGEMQVLIARLMAEYEYDEAVGCGDNLYDNGADAPEDKRFDTQFHDIYKNFKAWMVLGNHDANLHNMEKLKRYFSPLITPDKIGWEREINQVAHTYLLRTLKFFESGELNFLDLPDWILPSPYYAVENNSKLVSLHLNTNTLAKDFLSYMSLICEGKIPNPQENQIAFIETVYEEATQKEQKIRFIQHHPFFCFGKRAYPSGHDGNIYFSDNLTIKKLDLILQAYDDLPLIAKILAATDESQLTKSHIENLPDFSPLYSTTKLGNSNIDYAGVLRVIIFNILECPPHVVCSAHEHDQHISTHFLEVNGKQHVLTQLCSGGGGGELQDHLYHGNRNHLGAFYKKHGFFIIEFNAEDLSFTFDLITQDKHHLRFKHGITQAIRLDSNDERVELLRVCILQCVEEYFSFLHKRQMENKGGFYAFSVNRKHKLDDVYVADNLKNFFNQYQPATFEDSIKYIWEEGLEKLHNIDSYHSLYKIILNNFLIQFEIPFGQVYKSIINPDLNPVNINKGEPCSPAGTYSIISPIEGNHDENYYTRHFP